MRNPISVVKNHIDQNSHKLRDLAITTGVLAVGAVAIVKIYNSDSDASDPS